MDELNNELLLMCADCCFDENEAKKLIYGLNLNIEIPDPKYPSFRTSFLNEAVLNANIGMVRLLLQNGADPNFILYEEKPLEQDNPFWNLQYNDFGETAEENEVGLEMAQLMLEYGANPNITVCGEDLFSYVCFAVFNDDDPFELWEYRNRFFILLIAYGGSNSYCEPEIIKEFDKTNMSQYRFNYVPCGDGYYLTGEIVDKNFDVVARV